MALSHREITVCCLLLQMDDQGLVNTDPRNIAVPNTWVNLIPTDVRGLTFSRTPQMVRELSPAHMIGKMKLVQPVPLAILCVATATMHADRQCQQKLQDIILSCIGTKLICWGCLVCRTSTS